jgi:hypothetical protein
MRSFIRSHRPLFTVPTNSSKLLPISQTLSYPFRKQLQSVRPSPAFSLAAVAQNRPSRLRLLPQQAPHSFLPYLSHLVQSLLQLRVPRNLLLLVHSLSSAACCRAPNYLARPTIAPFRFLFRLCVFPHRILGLYSRPQPSTYHSVPPSHSGLGSRLLKIVLGLRDLPGPWLGLKAGWVQQMQNYVVISICLHQNAHP